MTIESNLKRLNFHPYYADLLQRGVKTTTLRITNRHGFKVGEPVMITTGWDEESAVDVHRAIISSVYRKQLQHLTKDDLDGESPDCSSAEAARLVLGCVYRRELSTSDEVWVIKFRHLKS